MEKNRFMMTIEVEGRGMRPVSEALANILREWEAKSAVYFGRPLPVIVVPQANTAYAADPTAVNSAIISKIDGEWKLMVILADLDAASDELIGHEVLHKTLELDGFRDLRHIEEPNSLIQTLTDSMLAHIPLNRRMRDHGLDPAILEDPNAQMALDRMARYAGFPPGKATIIAAVMYTDSILQSSAELSEAVRTGIRRFPEVSQLTEEMLTALRRFDMSQPDQFRVACHEIAEILGLRAFGTFVEYDHMLEAKKHVCAQE
jgi:hypothetical protein